MKKIIALILSVLLVVSTVACGKSKEFVFMINDEEIVMQQIDIFGFIYCMEHSLVSMDDLNKKYEDGKTYEQHYKEELERDIIKTVLLGKEAVANGVKLDSGLKDKAAEKTDILIEKYGEERLKSKNIKRDDVLRIYEWKVLGDYYADSLGETSEEGGESEDLSTDRYIRVFQVLFPTAKLNDDGMVSTDRDGNIIQVSSAEASRMKEDAEIFSENAKNNGDINELLKEYPASVRGTERILKYDDLDYEYKQAVDSLSVGDVSSVINSKYGFYVIRLIEDDEQEYGQIISSYEDKLEKNDAKEKLFDDLYKKYIGNNNEYRNNEQWKLVMIDHYY